jgi:hypothetical protein
MGHIKEPVGINFLVDPTPLTADDRKRISEVIAYYKETGKKMPFKKSTSKSRLATMKKKKELA